MDSGIKIIHISFGNSINQCKTVTNYIVGRFFGHFLNLNFCQCVCSTKHNGMMVLIGIIGEIFLQKKKSRPGSDRQECRSREETSS